MTGKLPRSASDKKMVESSAGPPMSRTGSEASTSLPSAEEKQERRSTSIIYLLFLIAYLAVQFGHGSNIGVAVSLPGSSKAMNLALGSWVMVGVSLGLPITPWLCRKFGVFRVCTICVVVDFVVILMMLIPGITLPQIYFVRFLVGFFEAPFLPYLQEWLARYGKHSWNVWNTVLHAMVPLGENLGYILAQELVAAGFCWQWAFAGQAGALAIAVVLCYSIGRGRYLDLDDDSDQKTLPLVDTAADKPAGTVSAASLDSGSPNSDAPGENDSEVEYPVTERWLVYWSTNASLAAQLGFLSGSKYVIRDYATRDLGYSLHFTIFAFSAIALIGPALGGSVAMSGNVVRPDQWSSHRRTLGFLACTSSVAAVVGVCLPYLPSVLFWPALFLTFIAAGGVYPAAQGIINIALTASRVIEASVYQVQCNNIFFAMPMPYVIGKTMDTFGYAYSFRAVTCLQVLAAAGFVIAVISSHFTEERSTWHRLVPSTPQASLDGSDGTGADLEMGNVAS